MEIQNFSHKHPLVFMEGVGENEVIVCRGCDEPILDAAYKCSESCSFFLHISCTQLQQEIQHPLHPKHPLVLIASEHRVCDGCSKSSGSCFFYHCGECRFGLDIKCASKWQSSAEDGHQHLFVPILTPIQFTCNICGEDRKGSARVCSICQLLVDVFCAQLAHVIQIAAHKDHLLTLIFCVDNHVKEQVDQVLCQLCFRTVNTKYGAYYCKQCDFVAHLNCAKWNSLKQFEKLDSSVNLQYLSLDSFDSASNVTKEISPKEDEATRDILQHFSHKHPLVFIEGVGENEVIVCTGCDEAISDAFYRCSVCSFFLHNSCTQLQQEIRHLVHPKHPLVLIASERKVCDGCCKSSKSCFFYHCEECKFNLDIKCASKWQSSYEDGHKHVFLPILTQIQLTCHICGEDHKGSARVCSICQLVIDTYCARLARTVQIGAHKDHFLTLTFCVENQVKQDDQVLCQLCFKTVNTKYGAYYCKQCTGFVAHLKCARRNSLQQFDNLDSSVYLQYLSLDSVDSATNLTKEICPGEEEGTWDILEEHPFVGEHNFILNTDKKLEADDKSCEVCMQLISGSFYSCATCSEKCNIFIHDTCCNLPIKKQHFLHKHPLTLSLGKGYIGQTFICKVCKHLRHGFRYRCDECNYDLDIHCSSIPDIIKHEAHQHSIRLAMRRFDEKCNGCENDIIEGAFVCIESECNFVMDFECAILPLKVKYDEYDRHILKLTYSTVEDDSGEYYCFICEEERNPKEWFYYCSECDFAAHTHCILGKYPYIKCGSTFVDKYHQHPLTFVKKTLFSPPCNICNKPFEGMGIECKQCEITFHPDLECSGKNFKNLRLINTQ